MGYNLSEEGRELAEQYQLGMIRKTYTTKVPRQSIGILVLVAICMCIIGLISFAISYDSSVFWLFLFIASFFLLMIPYFLVRSFLYRDLRVYVCTDGFIRVRGNEVYARHWDQIASVWVRRLVHVGGTIPVMRWEQAIPLQEDTTLKESVLWHYKVNAKDGTDTEFGLVLHSLNALGETIELEVLRAQQREKLHAAELSKALSNYAASVPVRFGNLTIGKKGIMKGTKILPWSQLGKIGLQGRMLWIRKKDNLWWPWARMPLDTIQNALLFVTLVEELKKVKQGTGHGTR